MMSKPLLIIIGLLLAAANALADDTKAADEELVAAAETSAEDNGPKQMSGMSILGNEEAPKALVIIPWKSSEIGEDISLSDTLDDRAQPVDKDVFLRELSFYEIRSAENIRDEK
jgi:hypothetical protein